jgi:hypothetical protein
MSVQPDRLTYMVHVRPQHLVDSALAASDAGMRDADNAALHGVAVKTIRRWRRLYQRRGLPRGQLHTTAPCPRCTSATLDEEAYAELLGWYLGDGHLDAGRRDVWNLHIFNDLSYPQDNERMQELMRRVKPGGRPHTRVHLGCLVITVSWKHWLCLFPQHGPSRKHLRSIVLEQWQRELVERQPSAFLRGLFHSDGCRVTNWATRRVREEVRRYEYPRWHFSNRSEDILSLCCWALDLAGISWRRSSPVALSVSQRDAVARLDELIGQKT